MAGFRFVATAVSRALGADVNYMEEQSEPAITPLEDTKEYFKSLAQRRKRG